MLPVKTILLLIEIYIAFIHYILYIYTLYIYTLDL